MANTRVEEIKKEIEGIKRQIDNPGTSEPVKKALESALKNAEAELKKEEGKGSQPDKGDDKKPSAEAKQKKKRASGSPKKKTPKKDLEDDLPETITVTVNGHTETIEIKDCESALRAMSLRKQRDAESSAKTKSRKPIEIAVNSSEKMVDHITDLIPDNKIKDEPGKVIKAIERFEKGLDKAVDEFKGIISDAGLAKIKKAFKDVLEEERQALEKSAEKK